MPKTWDVEVIYDTEIEPLMTQIIKIAQEHKIPMFATFQLNDNQSDGTDDGNGELFCTTALGKVSDRIGAERLLRTITAFQRSEVSMMAMTITSTATAGG